jgi:prepilin peptidase CpaA
LISIELKLIIISALFLFALVSDLRTYKIKNSITYSFMVVGLTANFAEEGFEGFVLSFQGIILPAACLMILYIMRIIGAGDIKLLSAVGAVMGSGFAIYATLYSFICGGFIATGIILIRRNEIVRFKYFLTYIKSCLLSMELLQYADFKAKQEGGRFHFTIAIASGTAAVIIIHGSELARL